MQKNDDALTTIIRGTLFSDYRRKSERVTFLIFYGRRIKKLNRLFHVFVKIVCLFGSQVYVQDKCIECVEEQKLQRPKCLKPRQRHVNPSNPATDPLTKIESLKFSEIHIPINVPFICIPWRIKSALILIITPLHCSKIVFNKEFIQFHF